MTIPFRSNASGAMTTATIPVQRKPQTTQRIAIYARISDDKKKIKAGIAGVNVDEQVTTALGYVARVFGLDPKHVVSAGEMAAGVWVPNPAAVDAPLVIYRENDTSAYKRKPTVAMDPVTREQYKTYRVLRPVWSALMSAVRGGKYGTVVSLDLDRYLRDPMDLEDAIVIAETVGVAWHETRSGDLKLHVGDGQLIAPFIA